jgi:aspartate-semialdehyde dehydrogenase
LAKPFLAPKARKLSVVGADTLLGREIQEVLADRKIGAAVTPYAASGEGNFAEQEGEPVYLDALEAASLKGQAAVIVAGSHDGALKAYNLAKAAGGHPPIIDCTASLEMQPEARIVAPLLSPEALDSQRPLSGWLSVVAHPAATALALVFARLARHKSIQQSVVNIFEPASERGKRGASELHQQTTGLLAFKPLEKKVYDAQLGFNMLSGYGEQAAESLLPIEQRIERHTATLLGRYAPAAPMPSLRLIQAPVFHGYSISFWVLFDGNIDAAEIGETLACAQIEVRGQDQDAPDNVGAAGQSGLIAGDIRVDRNNPHAAWLWLVADNLRLRADAVADLVIGLDAQPQ